MSYGLISRGGLAVSLALTAVPAVAAPDVPSRTVAHSFAHVLNVQASPPAAPAPSTPPDAVPPPILPAPHMPDGNPVVTLPPKESDKEGAANQAPTAVPGIPIGPNGAVFSFADLAAQLLDSVVYISTSQRVVVSGRAPTPETQAPAPDATPDSGDAPDGAAPDSQNTAPDTEGTAPDSEDAAPDAEGSAPDSQGTAPDTQDGQNSDNNQPGGDFFDELFGDNGNGTPDAQAVQSLGSGFVIDPSGLIVTNNHVIEGADEIMASFADGETHKATVVGIDEKTDLALLKVDGPHPFKAAKFGRSESLRVGDWVLAIGNPFGFGGSVTAGIVSALDRDINSGPYDHYIQTDASINRGNSGGPLFNIQGEVVGINTAIMSPSGGSIGIGFSVPSEIAVPVIEQLRRFGEVRRGWIGVRIQDVTDEVAAGLGMDKASGAFIAGTTDDGPAAKAGIKDGDVIVEFNGHKVDSMRTLPRLVADTPPGDAVDVTVMRDGKPVTLSIEVGLLQDEQKQASVEQKPGESPDQAAPSGPVDAAQMFGLSLGPITDDARKSFSLDSSVEGVLVTAVAPGSEAEEKNLKPGEVIVQVSQTDVTTPDEINARVTELKSEGRKTAMLLVAGPDNKMRFVSLRIDDAP